MAFMELQSGFGRWYLVETSNGTEIIPEYVCGVLEVGDDGETAADTEHWAEIVDALGDYVEGGPKSIRSVEVVEKWGARYSAPGYMDCTGWVLGDTQEEAEAECKAMYGDDDEEEEADDNSDEE